jgi:hypothetical protein
LWRKWFWKVEGLVRDLSKLDLQIRVNKKLVEDLTQEVQCSQWWRKQVTRKNLRKGVVAVVCVHVVSTGVSVEGDSRSRKNGQGLFIFHFSFHSAGDWIQVLVHARQALYHWAISLEILFFNQKILWLYQLIYPFTYWETSWWLLNLGSYEQSCYKHLCAGFYVDVKF